MSERLICPDCNTALEPRTYAPSEYGYAAKRSPWCPKCKRWRVGEPSDGDLRDDQLRHELTYPDGRTVRVWRAGGYRIGGNP